LMCPVPGCGKRGQHGDLMRHARVKHPRITSAIYQTSLFAGVMQEKRAMIKELQAKRKKATIMTKKKQHTKVMARNRRNLEKHLTRLTLHQRYLRQRQAKVQFLLWDRRNQWIQCKRFYNNQLHNC